MSCYMRQLSALARLSVLELYRRKDLVVVLVLSLVILAPLLFFTPFGMTGASRYMNELALLLVWLFAGVIGLSVAARLFPSEFETRTIFPLLAKPVGRGTVLLGKYLGALASALSALVVFYLAYILLTGLRQGIWFSMTLLQAMLLHAAFLVIIIAVSVLGSLVLTTSANLTLGGFITVGMLMFGQRLSALALQQPWPGRWILRMIDWFAPHLEFFDMRQRLIHDWPPLGWSTCFCVVLYAVCYAALCLTLAAACFRRRRF